METPLYEFDQVITCHELTSITNQLVSAYCLVPKWRFITRFKIKAQNDIILHLHEALHMKTKLMHNYKENPNE